MRTLVLDQSYQPHRIVTWQRAVSMLFVGKAEVVEEYDDIIRSVSLAMRMPAVVRLPRANASRKKSIKFSRLNVMMRDGFACQYCGKKKAMRELTYDHVLPRAQGGRTTWGNIVTACRKCNETKANRTPEEARMKLLSRPTKPTWLPTGKFYVDSSRVPETWKFWVGTTPGFA